MPKSRKADSGLHMVNPPGESFSRQTPQADQAGAKPREVGPEEVISTLKSIGKDWTDDIPSLLRLPERLFMLKSGDGTYYSGDERFGIMGIPAALGPEPLKAGKGDYGIALYSTGGGSVYFVLEDMSRGIIVRERIYCIHEKPPEGSWASVRGHIEAALAASSAHKGSVAVHDLSLRVLRQSS
jgi:hypothetical protein